MSIWVKKISLALLIIFAVSLTGCLSSGGGVKPVEKTTEDPTDPTQGGTVTEPETVTTTAAVYNPSGNKAPKITYFAATNIDSAYVSKGEKVEFEVTAFDPEGLNVDIVFAATAGTISQSGETAVWTAPNKAGVYQVEVTATDSNGIQASKSISLRVEKDASEGGIRFNTMTKGTEVSNAPQRAIISDTATTLDSIPLFVLSTDADDASHTVDIQVFFTDDSTSHVVTVSPEVGTATLDPIVDLGGGAYRADITYTAPTSTSAGQIDYDVVVNIFDPNDSSDEEILTIPFVINTPPTISSVRFSGASKNVIALGDTDTIAVIATEANQDYGDSLTYVFSIIDGSGEIDGGTANVSNTTGEVEFTAPATQSQTLILVQVVDSNGGADQQTFRIYSQNPMSIKVADESFITGDETDDYETATGDNAARYTLDTVVSGTDYYTIALGNDNAMSDAINIGGYNDKAQYYYTGASTERVGQTVKWTVYNSNGDLIRTQGGVGILAAADTSTAEFDMDANISGAASSGSYTLKGGTKTIRAEVTSGVETRYDEQIIRVNESPYVQAITFTDSNDSTVTVYNGTDITNFQIGLEETFTLNISTYDEDNNRVEPDEIAMPIANYKGFVANQASTGAAVAGLLFDINNLTNNVEDYDLDYTNADVSNPTITYDADYNTSFNDIEITIPDTATVDTEDTYKYILVHINDGEEQRVDIDGAGDDVDYYRVPLEIVPATATDVAARAVDIGILAGKTSYNKDLMLEFFDDNGTIKFRIKDLETNAYWTQSVGGDTIEITPPAADANNFDGDLGDADDDPFNTPGAPAATDGLIDIDDSTTDYIEGVDYLAIDINSTNWAAGDKVYFSTYANNIILSYQVVEGPRFTSISAPNYATLGDTVDIDINGYVPTDKTAVITAVLGADSVGTLSDALAETDSDDVVGERWQYTAPTSAAVGAEVDIIFTITDEDERSTSTTVTIEINHPPTIDGISPDGVSSANGEYWILGGTASVKMYADVTDEDDNDLFKTDWYSAYGNMSSNGVWNTSILTAASGPNSDGQIPVTLEVRDFDYNYEPKGGNDTKLVTINVNEAPETNGLQTILTDLSDADTNFANSSEYPDAAISFSFSTGATPDISDENDGDEDNLTYLFYITDEADNQVLNVGDVLVENETVDGIAAKKFTWTPNATARGTTANYKVWTRVSDPKPGNAKGIYTDSNLIQITADTTAPTLGGAAITEDEVNNMFIIGETVRFRFNVNSGLVRDAASAIINLSAFSGPASATMTHSDNGTDDDMSDDYFYYDYTMPRIAVGGIDAAAGYVATVTVTDINGNTAAAVASTNSITAIDNMIDLFDNGTSQGLTERRPNNNTITDLAPGTVLHIGDVLDYAVSATRDTSLAGPYAATDVTLDATVIGLGSAISGENVTGAGPDTIDWVTSHVGQTGANATPYTGTLVLGENADTSQYNENTDVIFTSTITDNAGNTFSFDYTLADIIANTTATGMDLKRPTVQQVKLLSYYNGGGVVGNRAFYSKNGEVYASNVNGVVVPAVPGTLLNIGASQDDADNQTMEVVMIQFDELMREETLTDRSIVINNATTGLDISTGSTSTSVSTGNNNFYYLTSWDHDSDAGTAALTNVLFIAVQDTSDAAEHIDSGTSIEILFTDKQAGVTTSEPFIVTDDNRNEIDYIGQDFSAPGNEYVQW